MTSTLSMPKPKPVATSASSVATGRLIPPIDRAKLFSDSEWEDFILEWADSLRTQYKLVERCGGAGDMGRDVIAFVSSEDGNDVWDNYQCKHYDHPLMPSDIWLELGKLVYYTYTGKFRYPRKYFFVAPQGAGTTLANLFRRPDELKAQLFANWEKKCSESITNKTNVPMDADLEAYINGLDFSVIGYLPPLRIIEQHAMTRYHVSRFGGGLPDRPDASSPPDKPGAEELGYITKLMDAYSDHLKRDVTSLSDLETDQDLKEHCVESRMQFYSAESLRSFSRDYLPPGEFQKLQDEVHEGIKDDIREDHPSGYKRLQAVVKTARGLQITSHALVSKLTIRDRGGICHQLANDKDEVRWVKK